MIAVLLLCILLQFEKLRGQCVGSPTYTTCGSSCQICQAQCEGWFCIEACETVINRIKMIVTHIIIQQY